MFFSWFVRRWPTVPDSDTFNTLSIYISGKLEASEECTSSVSSSSVLICSLGVSLHGKGSNRVAIPLGQECFKEEAVQIVIEPQGNSIK